MAPTECLLKSACLLDCWVPLIQVLAILSVLIVFSFAARCYKDKYWVILLTHLRSCHLIKQQEVASKIPSVMGEISSNFDMNVLYWVGLTLGTEEWMYQRLSCSRQSPSSWHHPTMTNNSFSFWRLKAMI